MLGMEERRVLRWHNAVQRRVAGMCVLGVFNWRWFIRNRRNEFTNTFARQSSPKGVHSQKIFVLGFDPPLIIPPIHILYLELGKLLRQ